MDQGSLVIGVDDPRRDDVLTLLGEHLADMRATSPPESIHALDPDALATPEITFCTARRAGILLGCAALKHHSPTLAEIKSMRTATAARNQGVARSLLEAVLDAARTRGYHRVSLETGSQDFFGPARSLYLRHGFAPCPPFADYRLDPNSVFMTLVLDTGQLPRAVEARQSALPIVATGRSAARRGDNHGTARRPPPRSPADERRSTHDRAGPVGR